MLAGTRARKDLYQECVNRCQCQTEGRRYRIQQRLRLSVSDSTLTQENADQLQEIFEKLDTDPTIENRCRTQCALNFSVPRIINPFTAESKMPPLDYDGAMELRVGPFCYNH